MLEVEGGIPGAKFYKRGIALSNKWYYSDLANLYCE